MVLIGLCCACKHWQRISENKKGSTKTNLKTRLRTRFRGFRNTSYRRDLESSKNDIGDGNCAPEYAGNGGEYDCGPRDVGNGEEYNCGGGGDCGGCE